MERTLLELLGAAGSRRVEVSGRELELRPASAADMLDALRDAEELRTRYPKAPPELLGNCCLLSRCISPKLTAEELLQRFGADDVEMLCAEYRRLTRGPSVFSAPEEIEELKHEMGLAAYERLKWRVLCKFGALPSEKRVRDMTDRDYLYCFINMRLDDEEQLERLCPDCRSRLDAELCPVCGEKKSAGFINPQFDAERYERMRENEGE